MGASNTCWGIELGAGAIKALKLERDEDELKVLDFAVIPHKRVLSTPDLDQMDATRVALGELVSTRDLSGAQIAISVPGHSSFARFAKLPPVEPKRIPDVVKFEAVQQIPFPIEQVEWDYQVFTSKDSPDVEVGIFAITREKVMERLTMWQDVGVTPNCVTLGPLAVYNAVAWDQRFNDQTPGTVILDVGTTSTDLIVCEPGRVWVRTFPIGGHNFTQALVEAFKLSYVKAEALKRQAEQSKHARHIFQAMRPMFADLAQDVQRSIGYYQSSHRDANLTRLIGLGSTFQLPGLRKYLSQQLQMEVVRLEQFSRLSVEGPMAGEFQAASLNLATAYGLALQGLNFDFGIMANLMPVSVVRESLWARKPKWFAVAAGFSVAAGAVSFVKPMLDRMTFENRTKPVVIDQVKNDIRKYKQDWTQIEQKFASNYMAANLLTLVQDRQVHAHLVNDLSKVMDRVQTQARDDEAARARESAQAGPISVNFLRYDTEYLAAGTPIPGQSIDRGFGDDSGQGSPRRIRVTLELNTTHPDPIRFIESTVKRWVFDNEKRDGIPYVIRAASYNAGRPVIEKISDEAPTRGPDGFDPWRDPPGGGGGGGGGGGLGGDGRDDRGGGGLGGGGLPGGPFGGPGPRSPGGPSPQPTPSAPDESRARDELNKLAPVPAAPRPGKPGQSLAKFSVTWEVEVRDPNAPQDGQENRS